MYFLDGVTWNLSLENLFSSIYSCLILPKEKFLVITFLDESELLYDGISLWYELFLLIDVEFMSTMLFGVGGSEFLSCSGI